MVDAWRQETKLEELEAPVPRRSTPHALTLPDKFNTPVLPVAAVLQDRMPPRHMMQRITHEDREMASFQKYLIAIQFPPRVQL